MAWYLLIELLYDVPIILFNLLLYWHIMNYIISYYLSYSCYNLLIIKWLVSLNLLYLMAFSNKEITKL